MEAVSAHKCPECKIIYPDNPFDGYDECPLCKANKHISAMKDNLVVLECLDEYGVDNWEGYSEAMVEAGKRINGG